MQQNPDAELKSTLRYWLILKRRRLLFLLPAVGITLATSLYALSLPATYRSEAIILIEDQAMSEDIVGTAMTSYASRQIQLISQRILTIKNVQEIVEEYDVFGPVNPEMPTSPTSLAARFRNNLSLDLISAEALDTRRAGESVIAFTLSFSSHDPLIAQQVTDELVRLFLAENKRSSSSRSTDVSEVLKAAVETANQELLQTETAVAEFKAQHEGALPELHQLNLNVINRAEQQASDVSSRIQQLEQNKLQLAAQLAQLNPSAPVTLPSGEVIMSDRDRFRALLVEYRRKSAIYKADHPDLVRLNREIESLRSTVGDADSRALLQEQLQQERDRLEGLRSRYSNDHPDVRNSETALAALEAQLQATGTGGIAEGEFANNPAYVLISTQLQSAEIEIQGLRQKHRELEATIARHEALIKQAPHVEMQYEALLRTQENARAKYRDLQGRLRAAEVAADVGDEMTERRFTLIEPAALPLTPSGPNRLAYIVMGTFLALGVGAGCVVLAEMLDHSIRSAEKLADITGSPPLAVIPYLNNSVDHAQLRTRRFYVITALSAASVICVAYVVFYASSI